MIVSSENLLFKIETNLDPHWESISPDSLMQKVLDHFGIQNWKSFKRAKKHNNSSEIFHVVLPGSSIVLRSGDLQLQTRTEVQSCVLNEIPFDRVVKPLARANGKYTFASDTRCWIIYPYYEGAIYDGKNIDLLELVTAAEELLMCLKSWADYRSTDGLSDFAHVIHQDERWIELKEYFFGDKNSFLERFLSPETIKLIEHNRRCIEKNIDEAIHTAQILPVCTLVHNDLQHANCLVKARGGLIFLDIEDICLECPEIALSHSIFKLLRHGIYMGQWSVEEGAHMLSSSILPQIKIDYPTITDVGKLRAYCSMRIVSNLWEILYASLYNRDNQYNYDFEKKIYNLLEVCLLTGEAI